MVQFDARRQYRTCPDEVNALAVELKYKRHEFPADVTDVSIGGIGVCVPRRGAILAVTPRETVYLKITAPSLREPMVEPGTVLHTRVMGDSLFLGVRFTDWLGLIERVPRELSAMFNRRLSPRIVVEDGHRVGITAVVGERTEEIEGFMRDLSSDGLSFWVPPEAGRSILDAGAIRVEFELPFASRSTAFKARLLHVTKDDEAWSFGAFFDTLEDGEAKAAREDLAAHLALFAPHF
ncbi:MAG TPA: PilZ domain-containing protein [Planctomycetota bacterium]|jgi:hypothetical protein|nr:PilZ domain-containing protein [Planctomycetota bacterium]OQC19770.1 MAG: PilZ domain protein [Planctomycetes bacterium ADurb.Bin069]NMD35596.1 PilZ domain-containing protein [Planctomycetota bacterium]HNR97742.1 PilZ domain-containing protein [Planctomycetota bacterium]HNU24791.1 PilZ domain-containing protein [Planctomycetota bacterium]